MTILNKTFLSGHGPFLEMVYCTSPLISEGWPSIGEYEKDIFFEFADDLLDDLCLITGQYCPFSPYEVTNLSDTESLQSVRSTFADWATIISNASDKKISRVFSGLYEPNKNTTPSSMRHDVLDTLEYIINYLSIAEKKGETITIIGI